MRILCVHNHYQQPGGEDQVFADEVGLLKAHGHQVISLTAHNDDVKGINPLILAKSTVWSQERYRQMRQLLQDKRPDIVHFHNTFPLLSPSVYYAAQAENVPVVQTLHNYRLLCPNAELFRDGRVCEDCLGKPPLAGVVHACYRSSIAATGVVATMLTFHRVLQTWSKMVDVYIALSEFARQKLIQGGLPAEKIVVKSNSVYPEPPVGEGKGQYALFVGRLSPEKGIGTLLESWKHLGTKIPLKVVGDGPLAPLVADAVQHIAGIEWLGHQPLEQVYHLMGDAKFLMLPSEWYEPFGRVAIEALSRGTPVVGSRIGAIAELIEHRRTGLLFQTGDAEDLAVSVEWLLAHPTELQQMRQNARAEFEAKYTADQNYQQLLAIYESALQRRTRL